MHKNVERKQYKQSIIESLQHFPCVALLGARQVGKSTLAKDIIKGFKGAVYLDLEEPGDLAKLQDPTRFLEANKDVLICLDEVQNFPELFSVLRGFLDRGNRPGQLLLLGSASESLIQKSSQSLAGRIAYIDIEPFHASEVEDISKLWLHGGYAPSFLANESISYQWRKNYIRTFLQRDIPALGIRIAPKTLERFWTMLAHSNGSVLNASKLAGSMGVSSPTIKHYLDILEGTFIIRQLQPFYRNVKKRLVKSPKVYIRDSGLVHALLGIEHYNDLLGHPVLGSTYESMVINSLMQKYPKHSAFFYRESTGAEMDLILEKGQERLAFEIKASTSPKIGQSFYKVARDIQASKSIVIAQVDKAFPISEGAWVYSLGDFMRI